MGQDSSKAVQLFYVKRAGRITGPFPPAKLNAIFKSGGFSPRDMFSVDKANWQSICLLFPELMPENGNKSEKMELAQVSAEQGNAGKNSSGAVNTDQGKDIGIFSGDGEKNIRSIKPNIFSDAATAVALVWKYHSLLSEARTNWKRVLAAAIILNLLAGLTMVVLFGKYYSRSFHYFFSLFTAFGLLAVLLGVAFGASWLLGRCGKKKGEFIPGEWQICACAIFMDYGLIACSLMGLLHTLKSSSPAGWNVLFAVNGITLCSSASLLTVSCRRFRNFVSEGLYLAAVPINMLLCTGIWFFVKMI